MREREKHKNGGRGKKSKEAQTQTLKIVAWVLYISVRNCAGHIATGYEGLKARKES